MDKLIMAGKQREAIRLSARTAAVTVLLFYMCFFLLTSSGRLSSGDAGTQLQAAMLLANTGSLGTRTPPTDNSGGHGLWVLNSRGLYYQCHDIGNVLLMYPAAWVSSTLSRSTRPDKIQTPPILAKVAVALTYSVLSAVACFFLYCLFNLYYDVRRAFLLSFLFVVTTIFLPYTKSAWDVLGASCFVCILLYFSARLLSGNKPLPSSLWMGLTAAFACSFRFSLAPFLLLSLLAIMYFSGQNRRVQKCLLCVAGFMIAIIPTLIYNYIRMGSPLRPATTAPAYIAAGTADMTGNIFSGLYGLLVSPNKGLLVFAPIFALLIFLPLVWKKAPQRMRQLCTAFGLGAALHILFLAKLRGWGSFGWGPRYLVSVLPILFFLVSMAFVELWGKQRKLLIALVCLSAIVCLPPALVNWHLAITEYPQALNPFALRPYQLMAVGNGLLLGLQGKLLPAPAAILNDPIRSGSARFPDFWTVRLMEHSQLGLIVGVLISILLAASAIWTFRRLIQPVEIEVFEK